MSDDGGGGHFVGFGRMPNFQLQGMQQATTQITALNTAVTQLMGTIGGVNTNLGNNLTRLLGQINTSINQTTQNINNLNNAAGAGGGGGTSGGGGGGGRGMFATAIGGMMNVAGSDIFKDLAMFPLRFINQTVGSNRQLGMNLSSQLSGEMYATGATESLTANMLSRFPGNVRGSPEDLINLINVARQAGAFIDINRAGVGGQGPLSEQPNARATGFLQAVSQAQAMTPGVSASQIASTIGGFSANVGAQQQGAFITGGAFAMLAAGGRHKSLSEWAEDIIHWFEQLRGGEMKGKQFSYGELVAQYFPGSNIDVWFQVNGVPEGMREYWWNYALAKARTGGAQGREMLIQPRGVGVSGPSGNQAWERLQSTSSQARGQLRLASALSGTYANKEQANRWFNDLMGQLTSEVIPAQMSKGALSALQYLPDAMEELMMGFLERSGPIGAMLGGGIGYGIEGGESLIKNLMSLFGTGLGGASKYLPNDSMQNIMGGWAQTLNPMMGANSDIVAAIQQQFGITLPGGDAPASSDIHSVHDLGDMEFGNMGTRSLRGLHPDMRKKLGRMMSANPALQINSGLRDTWQQMQLKNQGHSRVSGQPSAHTRGQAADLGPPSQYPWIMANARKFGLKSGRSVGEPWHVGLGDPETHIGDYTDPDSPEYQKWLKEYQAGNITLLQWIDYRDSGTIPSATTPPAVITPSGQTTGGTGAPTGLTPGSILTNAGQSAGGIGTAANQPGLGRLFDLFTGGFGRENVVETISSMVPSMMALFLGMFGMGKGGDQSMLNYAPELYDLFNKTRQYTIGGIQAAPTGAVSSWNPLAFQGPSTTTTTGTDGVSTSGEARSLLEALRIVERPKRDPDPTTLSTGSLIARLAFAAGFRGEDLTTVVGISHRESGWSPTAHNDHDPRDNSYGLMQINMKDDDPQNPNMGVRRMAQFQAAGIDMDAYEDLKDPWINMQAAYYVSGQGSSWSPWSIKGDPFAGWRAPAATTSAARAFVVDAGLGDAEMALMAASAPPDAMPGRLTLPMQANGAAGVTFNNTFVVQGGGDPRSGGIDVRRTVSIIADHLEAEMKKRVSRRN